MSRHALGFLRFIAVFCAVLAVCHFYVWRRLIRDVALSPARRRAATAAFFLLIAVFLTGGMAGRFAWSSPTWMRWTANIWVGLLGLTVCWLLLFDGLRAVWLRARAKNPVSPERRLFLARALAGSAAALSAGLAAAGVHEALRPVRVKKVELSLKKLPPGGDGYRIVQISDVHVGPLLRLDFVEQVAATIRGLAPDLIAITGDLVDGEVGEIAPLLAPLQTLSAPDGVFFITGNHEYYVRTNEWLAYLPKLGIRPLQNERVRLAHFELAGIPDLSAKDFLGVEPANLGRALEGRDSTLPVILLAHQPKHAYEAMAHGVDLQLSGHTHGGQMFPLTVLMYLKYPFITGLYRRGPFQVYVSAGTGYWGPPMRLGTEAEVTEITLRSRA